MQFYRIPMTPEAFRAWLETKQEGCIVGYTRDGKMCPLASYVRENLDTKEMVVVGEGSYGYLDDQACTYSLSTPEWATLFIRYTDSLAHAPVSVEKAQEILKTVEARLF